MPTAATEKTIDLHFDLDKYRNVRRSRFNTVYKLAGNTVAVMQEARPHINRERMSARAIINTAAIDREGEQIIPSGVQTDNYAQNPVVMWGHGLEGITIPIAKCEHPDGTLAIRKNDREIEGTSYFSPRIKESEQIFALIDEGIVRGTSIHVAPLTRQMKRFNGQPYVSIDESDLLEWSWGAIPVNPQAIAKVLSRKRLCGSPLSQTIRKSLIPFAPPRRALGIGWRAKMYDRKKLKAMSEEELIAARENAVDDSESQMVSGEMARRLRAKADELDAEYAPPPEARDRVPDEQAASTEDKTSEYAPPAAEEVVPPEEEDDEYASEKCNDRRSMKVDDVRNSPEAAAENDKDAEEYQMDTPLGASVLASYHKSISDIVSMGDASMAPLEQPQVREGLGAINEDLRSKMNELEGMYSELYPNLDAIGNGKKPNEQSQQPDEEALKSWLASSSRSRYALRGVADRLQFVGRSKSLSPFERSTLQGVRRDLRHLIESAKSFSGNSQVHQLQRENKQLRSLLERFVQSVPA